MATGYISQDSCDITLLSILWEEDVLAKNDNDICEEENGIQTVGNEHCALQRDNVSASGSQGLNHFTLGVTGKKFENHCSSPRSE